MESSNTNQKVQAYQIVEQAARNSSGSADYHANLQVALSIVRSNLFPQPQPAPAAANLQKVAGSGEPAPEAEAEPKPGKEGKKKK